MLTGLERCLKCAATRILLDLDLVTFERNSQRPLPHPPDGSSKLTTSQGFPHTLGAGLDFGNYKYETDSRFLIPSE